jgi:hypothetical protein
LLREWKNLALQNKGKIKDSLWYEIKLSEISLIWIVAKSRLNLPKARFYCSWFIIHELESIIKVSFTKYFIQYIISSFVYCVM